ncbi:hypothetical protein BGZ61DRAFT_440121 [Ilyonectria robusta]|uniref:uncharacterized protein n=1 Tax=Ilyonectria robusta TaxID=1079257 RepID=UPI001E8D1BEA|nr:uncharacterized protein BGZ61DRAFT_440121 [Ilyonectria robusta]KAH8735369.1 hypothetical protein BGZ61DRAFT_440121 [Ilyonectria robusta]
MEEHDKTGGNAGEGDGRISNNTKGKEKHASTSASRSIANRLQASGRLALNAVTGGPDLASQQVGEKGAASFSNLDTSKAGEASSHRLHWTGMGDSMRMQTSLDTSTASRAFNDFVGSGSSLDFEQQHHHQQSYQRDSSFVKQQRVDGAAVVNLLDGPDDDELDLGAHTDAADDDGLSPEAAAKLREALFNSTHLEPRWDDMLNFTPDFLSEPAASAEDAQLHLGTRNLDEARSIWLHQWSDVLSSYTDQVWGDLEPLAAEARREVEELSSREAVPNQAPETKALDRLRQILAHVRGH